MSIYVKTPLKPLTRINERTGKNFQIKMECMQPDGSLFSGMDAIGVLRELEEAGAAAVGFNCVAADEFMPALVSKMRRRLKGPIICKPNAGIPMIVEGGIAEYPMGPEEFAQIQKNCFEMGASLLGGCCGTAPEFIRAMVDTIGVNP